MNSDSVPRRPVIKSSLAAQADWDHWLNENSYKQLKDSDGLVWNLELTVEPTPDDEFPRMTRWVATAQLFTEANVDAFVQTGTLDPVEDSRLISLIGNNTITLRIRPIVQQAVGESEGREVLLQMLPGLRDNLLKLKMKDIKRGLIGRWIDEHCIFGADSNPAAW